MFRLCFQLSLIITLALPLKGVASPFNKNERQADPRMDIVLSLDSVRQKPSRFSLLKGQIEEWKLFEADEQFAINFIERENGLLAEVSAATDAGHWARIRWKWAHSFSILIPVNFALGKAIWMLDPNAWFPPHSVGLNNVMAMFIMIPAFQFADDFYNKRFTKYVETVVGDYQKLAKETIQKARVIKSRMEVTVFNRAELNEKTIERAKREMAAIDALKFELNVQMKKVLISHLGLIPSSMKTDPEIRELRRRNELPKKKSFFQRPGHVKAWNAQLALTKAHYQNLAFLSELKQRLAQAMYTQLEVELEQASGKECRAAVDSAIGRRTPIEQSDDALLPQRAALFSTDVFHNGSPIDAP